MRLGGGCSRVLGAVVLSGAVLGLILSSGGVLAGLLDEHLALRATAPVPLAGARRLATATVPDASVASADWLVDPNSGGPPGLFDAAFASDPASGQVLLFGGCGGVDCSNPTNATWLFHAGNWTRLAPLQSPPARSEAMMTFDALDGYFLLYGGRGTSGDLNDTWTFFGGVWQELVEPLNPGPRAQGMLAYDPALSESLLVGGYVYTTSNVTWAFSGGSWANLTVPSAPGDRSESAMAYDPSTQTMILYGGLGSGGSYLADTWSFNASGWAQLHLSGPPLRAYPVMAFDGALGALILFDGEYVTLSNFPGVTYTDTWSFSGGAWTQLGPAHLPPGGSDGAAAYDPTTQAVLAIGGCSSSACPNSATYEFALPDELTVTFQPTGCGPVSVGVHVTQNGTQVALADGSYRLTAPRCANSTFQNWSVLGSASLSTSSLSTTVLTISGPASVMATYLANASRSSSSGGSGLGGLPASDWLFIAIVAAAAIAVSVGVLIARRRRGRPTAEPGSGDDAPTEPDGAQPGGTEVP